MHQCKKSITTVLLFIVLSLVMSIAFAQKGTMTIAVVNFRNRSGYSGEWSLGDGMSDMLATALFKTGKFKVVERGQLGIILKERQMALDGELDAGFAMKLGQLTGADYIITGTVSEFGLSQGGIGGVGGGFHGFGGLGVKTQTARVVVDVRIIDVKNGQIVAADQGEGKESTGSLTAGGGNWHDYGGISFGSSGFDSSLPGKATRKAINSLVEKISGYIYNPKIVDVSGNEVTINVGSSSGIKPNTKMKVISQGKEIIDPDTKQVLGRKKSEIGQIKITSVEEKYSTGIIISSIGAINVGDLVEKMK